MPFYYFRRGGIYGQWKKAFVRSASDYIVDISQSTTHRVKPLRAAYEYIRLSAEIPLLQDPYEANFVFPGSYLVMNM